MSVFLSREGLCFAFLRCCRTGISLTRLPPGVGARARALQEHPALVGLEQSCTQLRHFDEFQPLHVRPRDVRGLRPVAPEHDHHATLRVVACGIVVAADLLS